MGSNPIPQTKDRVMKQWKKKYINVKDPYCPACHGFSIEFNKIEILISHSCPKRYAERSCVCTDCESEWIEKYEITDVEIQCIDSRYEQMLD